MQTPIGKQYSAFYKKVLQNLASTPKNLVIKMTDQRNTSRGHNTRSREPKCDRPLRVVKDMAEYQQYENSDDM